MIKLFIFKKCIKSHFQTFKLKTKSDPLHQYIYCNCQHVRHLILVTQWGILVKAVNRFWMPVLVMGLILAAQSTHELM